LRTILTSVLAIGCFLVLIFGNLHWDKRTSVGARPESDVEGSTVDKEVQEVEQKAVAKEDVFVLAQNWPENARTVLEMRLKEGVPLRLAIVGSPALGGANGWADRLQKELVSQFGNSVIEVGVFTYDMHSLEFVQEKAYEEVVEFEPDMLLWEPLTLKDNGLVVIEHSHENILFVFEQFTDKPVVILQPPHPIYQARYYPVQVDALAKFAEQEGFTYLNHWEVWPDPNSEEILNYLLEDQSAPNEQGHELWYDYLAKIFLSAEQ
jgi:hypothetical protein